MTESEKLGLGLVLAAVGVVALVALGRKVGQAINPLSDRNLAYGAANATLSGLGFIDERDTFGTYLAERFSADPREAERIVQRTNVNVLRMEQGLPPVDTSRPWNREGNIGLKPPASAQETIDRNREGYSRDMIR